MGLTVVKCKILQSLPVVVSFYPHEPSHWSEMRFYIDQVLVEMPWGKDNLGVGERGPYDSPAGI